MTFPHFIRPEIVGVIVCLVFFRVAPFAVWACTGVRGLLIATVTQCFVTALMVAAAWQLGPSVFQDVVQLSIGLLYFLVLAFSVHSVAALRWWSGKRKWLLFLLLFSGCVVVPAYAFRGGVLAGRVLLAYGFELSLAAYSYCSEVGDRSLEPRTRECLFFLLVNPELVFPSWGKACEARLGRGAARAALGIAVLAAANFLGPAVVTAKPAMEMYALQSGMTHGALAFVQLYAAHSALAHLQIGLCVMLGYRPPERYVYPFLADSPVRFWERWNRYMGEFIRGYVYFPILRSLKRDVGGSRWAAALAALCAFGAMGILHDAYWFLVKGEFKYLTTLGFLAWGALIPAWFIFFTGPGRSGPMWWRRSLAALSRVALYCAIGLSCWLFL